MIVDSSAIVAIVLREPGYERLSRALASRDGAAGAGTPTLVESGLVLVSRAGRRGRIALSHFVADAEIEAVPFGEAHWQSAVTAFQRFGKGRHPARLNFGDCLTYATAKVARQPLLCLGDDFAQTDLELVALQT